VRAEFYRGDDADTTVGVARVEGPRIEVESDDPATRAAIGRIFRLTPVVLDDASLRSLGASGEAVLEPGSAEWFRAAATQRAAHDGLSVRLVPEASGNGGWDPASAYCTFRQSVNRILAGSHPDAEPRVPTW
jgi:hypothetical protein